MMAISDGVVAFLKDQGFHQRKSRFYLDYHSCLIGIEFQQSRYQAGYFVNLGLLVKSLASDGSLYRSSPGWHTSNRLDELSRNSTNALVSESQSNLRYEDLKAAIAVLKASCVAIETGDVQSFPLDCVVFQNVTRAQVFP